MKQYAKTSWVVGDVQTLFDVSDEQAAEFLANNEHKIQDQLIQNGWQVIQTMGEMEELGFDSTDHQQKEIT